MPDNNLFEIKKRVTAARQTRKITRTMELIASSRLQRGKVQLAHVREWAAQMRSAARCLPDACFEPRDEPNRGRGEKMYIVFGGKKGLSGAYSPNLMQYAKPIVEGQLVVAVGSAAQASFPAAQHHFGDGLPSADVAADIVQVAEDRYEGGAEEVHLIYMRGTKHVTAPLFPPPHPGIRAETVITEPSAQRLCPALLRAYAEALVLEAHLQAFVAEQIARVAAMDSAAQNADEIIDNLQASYNRIRQATITQEIILVGGAGKREGKR